MKTRKRRKPEVGTWYCLREKTTGRYYTGGWIGGKTGEFPKAALMSRRSDVARTAKAYPEWEIVDVRCRPLSTKTKRSAKRTR